MDIFNNSIIMVDIAGIHDISPGKSLLLANSILGKVFKLYPYDNDKKEKIMLDFFKEPCKIFRYHSEKDVVEEIVNAICKDVRVRVGDSTHTSVDMRNENLVVNINNLCFFNQKLWPVIAEKIIKEEILVSDYIEKEKKIIRFSLSLGIIRNNYPKNMPVPEMLELFLDDLQHWLYFNVLHVRDIDYVKDKNDEKLIILI